MKLEATETNLTGNGHDWHQWFESKELFDLAVIKQEKENEWYIKETGHPAWKYVDVQEYADDDHEANLRYFEFLVKQYDFYYWMSDDHRVWKAGTVHDTKINQASIDILPDEAAEIWNTFIDNSIKEEGRAKWYRDSVFWLEIRSENVKF